MFSYFVNGSLFIISMIQNIYWYPVIHRFIYIYMLLIFSSFCILLQSCLQVQFRNLQNHKCVDCFVLIWNYIYQLLQSALFYLQWLLNFLLQTQGRRHMQNFISNFHLNMYSSFNIFLFIYINYVLLIKLVRWFCVNAK